MCVYIVYECNYAVECVYIFLLGEGRERVYLINSTKKDITLFQEGVSEKSLL